MNEGSTDLALARELVAERVAVTVVTPGVNVATYLSENPAVTAYLLGGRVRHRTLGTSGGFAEGMLAVFNADVAFIAVEGLSVRDGLTYSYESDARLARSMSEPAARTVVLATARKLEQRDRISVKMATPNLHVGRGIGGLNIPVYLRNVYRSGAPLTPNHRLKGIRRDGNALVGILWNELSRVCVKRGCPVDARRHRELPP